MKHLRIVGENYFKHMLEAFFVSLVFLSAGLICLIHSVFPFLFETTASGMVKFIIDRTNKRQGIDE